MTWPLVPLRPILRLQAIASAYPSAGVAETTVAMPYEEAWTWLTDLERSIPSFDTTVRKVRIRDRSGSSLRMWVWVGPSPVPVPFTVTVEDGFCLMAARLRLFVAVMAAEPTADGGTRFVHLEALPVRRLRVLRFVFRRLVRGDIRRFRRCVRA